MLDNGERQVAPELTGIRRDHVARYEWAAERLAPTEDGQRPRIVDLACGIGYGAKVLAEAGCQVLAVDRDEEAIAYGATHYGHGAVTHLRVGAEEFGVQHGLHDAAVCFETIEHIEDPAPVLEALNRAAPLLLASVPNETVFPYRNHRFHFRHYTADEFQALLNATGWEVTEWWGQEGPESEVCPNVLGRTLIAVAQRSEAPRWLEFAPVREREAEPVEPTKPAGIGHVVIVGLGPSAESYVDLVKRLGGRAAFADQVWTINALGDVLASDLVFHMDNVRVQEIRAAAAPQSNIARMLEWMRSTKVPIMTSRAHTEYPSTVDFPLEDVVNELGYAYFNGTAAYACAYAIYMGATKISFFGCDYTMANSHHAEKGRGCLEFWIGYAAAKGIELGFSDRTSLMDTVDEPRDPRELNVYGYDMERVLVDVIGGRASISFEPKAPPTAAEMEARYDHTRPTNPLLRG